MADTLTHEKRELLESTAPRRLGKAPHQQAPAPRIHMAAGPYVPTAGTRTRRST
jgi:hypothetical protein